MEKIKKIEQRHRCLPETMTVEQLAIWIETNQKSVREHIDKIPLSPEEVAELEHKSSAASRSIDRLEEVKEMFMSYLKEGTKPLPEDEGFQPQDITIPPTKGLKALKANREYADSILEKGYNEEETKVYIIPYPDEQMMVAVDIEGFECPDYTKAMTDPEKELYGRLFVKDGDGNYKQIEDVDIDVKGNTANIKVPKRTKHKEGEPFI